MRRLLLILPALGLALATAWAADPVPPNPTIGRASNLPVISLRAAKPIGSEPRVPCTVEWTMPGGGVAGSTGAMTGLVRFHGATSQGYAKKSFALTLDAPVDWPGLREGTHWVLNAAFVDRSLMRHKLSYDLFRSLSTDGAPRFASSSRFVEVNLDGKYHGAYLLMERVDAALLGLRRFESNAPAHAVIYKAVDHSANFAVPGHPGYEQREPDPQIRQSWGPLDELNAFTSRSPDAKFFDAETGAMSRFDVDNVIDFHLLVLMTSNMDGIDKNFILARDSPTPAVPKPRFFFVPWDYDATFGRNWEASRVGPTAWISSHLFDRLLGDAAYRGRFGGRWRQLRERQFSVGNLHRMIDENVRTLGVAASRNEVRWKDESGRYPDRLSFDEDVMQMKEWVVERTRWLDAEITRRGGKG